MQKTLKGLRIAALVTDGFEQVELTKPVEALRCAGAEVEIVSLHGGSIRGMNHLLPGKKVSVDRKVSEADPVGYDGLLLPGGLANPDALRQSEEALDFVRHFDRSNKPIAVICHGPQVLVSAGLIKGRQLAAWNAIRDDITNAGGTFRDEPMVRDRNWVSSRNPADLPAFVPAMKALFAERAPRPSASASRRRPWAGTGRLVAGALGLLAAGIVVRQIVAARS